MEKFKRIEILSNNLTPSPGIVQSVVKYLELPLQMAEEVRLYWIQSERKLATEVFSEIFVDDVLQTAITTLDDSYNKRDFDFVVETSFKPGVTDNSARSALDALKLHPACRGQDFKIATGKMYLLKGKLTSVQVELLSRKILANELLENIKIYSKDSFLKSDRFTNYTFPEVKLEEVPVKTYSLDLDDHELEKMSQDNLWALSLSEMHQVKKYYADEKIKAERLKKKLPSEPTDVEIEILAQSWSEHCKHKIFGSEIDYIETDNKTKTFGSSKIKSLYKTYIKGATNKIADSGKADWLVSVFSDNAGIVRFDKNIDLCIKVETHNSPSALDPYGGALTGILGVNRDIMGCGIGAKPIANTDVFCFADQENLNKANVPLPEKLLQPQRIFQGVHKGVEDGGNKSGIPTINGAIFFDDNYAGKPLVYCGTVGVLPQKTTSLKPTHEKNQKPGNLIVVVGGAVGKDGIHGATFSSLELTEGAPATVVQIGDPITQKRVMDFLLAAQKQELYCSITDNGAGGLSSSIGEMAAQTNGARIDLKKSPIKYPGLSPFEIMISESQERMSVAVEAKEIKKFLAMAEAYGVKASVLGEFTDSGFLEIFYGEKLVAYLNLSFIHDSLIPLKLKAKWTGPEERVFWHKKETRSTLPNVTQKIFEQLLARPNIKSKEAWVRQYDHEVQAATLVKPFTGKTMSGPSDAGVVWLYPHGGEENQAVTISCGMWPQISHYDCYLMALYSVDEAVRNAISTGANPKKMVLVDNFCWPDPVLSQKNPDAEYKCAQLVRANLGLYEAATTYSMPFVSGKDSMKNDYYQVDAQGKPLKISVPPTLLVTAMGEVEEVENLVTTDFKKADDLIYMVGLCQYQNLNESELSRTFLTDKVKPEDVNLDFNFSLYQKMYQLIQNKTFSSVHDISDGGMLTAVFESCLGGDLGAELELSAYKNNLLPLLFNESTGRFVLSLNPKDEKKMEAELKDFNLIKLGKVTSDSTLKINKDLTWNMSHLSKIWRGLP
ncbi:MAG: hypothetical protein JNM93_12475 [Bacteriovoracaceae bacterium]|nr:hypothetical protein [Bacteriovoracaceae bacterium]